jgi:hypothetical protein
MNNKIDNKHEINHWPITAEYINRHGNTERIPIGQAVQCTCGLAMGSAPGDYALRVYEMHRADFCGDG